MKGERMMGEKKAGSKGRFSRALIEAIREQADLVKYVGEYVELHEEAGGRRYRALCPFHDEKTPSFTIFTDDGQGAAARWYCFGCHRSGDIFTFASLYHNLSFPESVRHVAEFAGITLPQDDNAELSEGERRRIQEERRLYDLRWEAGEWMARELWNSPRVLEWLQGRGVSLDTIRAFGLGYNPRHSPSKLFRYLRERGYSDEEIRKAGLMSERGGDYLNGRVVFPILSPDSTRTRRLIVGFGGREMERSDYRNTVFAKRSVLFAEYQSRPAILRHRSAVIVEGYFDALVAHSATLASSAASVSSLPSRSGYANVMAAMGTALTYESIERLVRRYGVRRLIIAMDGDKGGREGLKTLVRSILRASSIRVPSLQTSSALRDGDNTGAADDNAKGGADTSESQRTTQRVPQKASRTITPLPIFRDLVILVVKLPQGMDPDEAILEGVWDSLLRNPVPLYEAFTEIITEEMTAGKAGGETEGIEEGEEGDKAEESSPSHNLYLNEKREIVRQALPLITVLSGGEVEFVREAVSRLEEIVHLSINTIRNIWKEMGLSLQVPSGEPVRKAAMESAEADKINASVSQAASSKISPHLATYMDGITRDCAVLERVDYVLGYLGEPGIEAEDIGDPALIALWEDMIICGRNTVSLKPTTTYEEIVQVARAAMELRRMRLERELAEGMGNVAEIKRRLRNLSLSGLRNALASLKALSHELEDSEDRGGEGESGRGDADERVQARLRIAHPERTQDERARRTGSSAAKATNSKPKPNKSKSVTPKPPVNAPYVPL